MLYTLCVSNESVIEEGEKFRRRENSHSNKTAQYIEWYIGFIGITVLGLQTLNSVP